MISDQERCNTVLSLVDNVHKITQNIPCVPGLKERLEQVSEGFVIVAPDKNDAGQLAFKIVFQSVPNLQQSCMKFYPHYPEDAQIHERLTGGVTAKALVPKFMAYTSVFNQITLNARSDETASYMATCAIHELGHKLWAQRLGVVMVPDFCRPETEWIAEEMEMRTFDYKLLLAIGGPSYQGEFDRGVYWVKKFRQKPKPGVNLGTALANAFKGRGVVLDPIFGPAPNECCALERDGLFCLHCELAAADRNLTPEAAHSFKCGLMSAYYAGKFAETAG